MSGCPNQFLGHIMYAGVTAGCDMGTACSVSCALGYILDEGTEGVQTCTHTGYHDTVPTAEWQVAGVALTCEGTYTFLK